MAKATTAGMYFNPTTGSPIWVDVGGDIPANGTSVDNTVAPVTPSVGTPYIPVVDKTAMPTYTAPTAYQPTTYTPPAAYTPGTYTPSEAYKPVAYTPAKSEYTNEYYNALRDKYAADTSAQLTSPEMVQQAKQARASMSGAGILGGSGYKNVETQKVNSIQNAGNLAMSNAVSNARMSEEEFNRNQLTNKASFDTAEQAKVAQYAKIEADRQAGFLTDEQAKKAKYDLDNSTAQSQWDANEAAKAAASQADIAAGTANISNQWNAGQTARDAVELKKQTDAAKAAVDDLAAQLNKPWATLLDPTLRQRYDDAYNKYQELVQNKTITPTDASQSIVSTVAKQQTQQMANGLQDVIAGGHASVSQKQEYNKQMAILNDTVGQNVDYAQRAITGELGSAIGAGFGDYNDPVTAWKAYTADPIGARDQKIFPGGQDTVSTATPIPTPAPAPAPATSGNTESGNTESGNNQQPTPTTPPNPDQTYQVGDVRMVNGTGYYLSSDGKTWTKASQPQVDTFQAKQDAKKQNLTVGQNFQSGGQYWKMTGGDPQKISMTDYVEPSTSTYDSVPIGNLNLVYQTLSRRTSNTPMGIGYSVGVPVTNQINLLGSVNQKMIQLAGVIHQGNATPAQVKQYQSIADALQPLEGLPTEYHADNPQDDRNKPAYSFLASLPANTWVNLQNAMK